MEQHPGSAALGPLSVVYKLRDFKAPPAPTRFFSHRNLEPPQGVKSESFECFRAIQKTSKKDFKKFASPGEWAKTTSDHNRQTWDHLILLQWCSTLPTYSPIRFRPRHPKTPEGCDDHPNKGGHEPPSRNPGLIHLRHIQLEEKRTTTKKTPNRRTSPNTAKLAGNSVFQLGWSGFWVWSGGSSIAPSPMAAFQKERAALTNHPASWFNIQWL